MKTGRNYIIIIILALIASCDNELSPNIKREFNSEELEYFSEIGFGSEFRKKKNPRLLFWRYDVEVKLNGNYTIEDSLEVSKVIKELNQLIDPIEIKIVKSDGNINMRFVPRATFNTFPGYKSGNIGYFRIERIAFFPKAFILIDQLQSINKRKHLIREELTQVLGLKNDSYTYPQSIFYQDWSDVTEYSEIDKQLIRLMYNYKLPYAMKKSDFIRFINNQE